MSRVLKKGRPQKVVNGSGPKGEKDLLHSPSMIVNNGESTLRGLSSGLTAEDGSSASVTEDSVEDSVVDVVIEGSVDGGQLDAADKGSLVMRLGVVHANAEAVHGSGAAHEANQSTVNTAAARTKIDMGFKNGAKTESTNTCDGVL